MTGEFFRNEKVLVTGGTGLVGSNLVARLQGTGASIRATYHRVAPKDPAGGVEYVKADLTNADDCRRAVEGISYVFHCAANTPGAGATVGNPLAHVTSNILIDSQMLEAAYRAGVKKFLWLGSTTAYPPTGERPVREEELFTGDPHEKYFFMGWTKRFTEVLCRMYGEKLAKPMTAIVLRLSYVYGPGDNFDPAVSHVIPALIRKVVERQDPLEVWGTGEDIRDPLYVGDAVRAMMLAIERVERYDAFNIGLGKGYSVKEMLKMILELDGYADARVVFDPSKPSTILVRYVDTTKAETALGFRVEVDLREGLEKTIRWYRDSCEARGQ